MTVQDLMRHTSGLTYGIFGNSPVDQAYTKAGLFMAKSLADQVKTIASRVGEGTKLVGQLFR